MTRTIPTQRTAGDLRKSEALLSQYVIAHLEANVQGATITRHPPILVDGRTREADLIVTVDRRIYCYREQAVSLDQDHYRKCRLMRRFFHSVTLDVWEPKAQTQIHVTLRTLCQEFGIGLCYWREDGSGNPQFSGRANRSPDLSPAKLGIENAPAQDEVTPGSPAMRNVPRVASKWKRVEAYLREQPGNECTGKELIRDGVLRRNEPMQLIREIDGGTETRVVYAGAPAVFSLREGIE